MNDDTPTGPVVEMRDNLRGASYCEIFVIRGHLNHLEGKVYNSLGLNECPQEQWMALNTDALKKKFKAQTIVMNGPRYFLMDKCAIENTGEVLSFDGLQLRRVATLRIPRMSVIGGSK